MVVHHYHLSGKLSMGEAGRSGIASPAESLQYPEGWSSQEKRRFMPKESDRPRNRETEEEKRDEDDCGKISYGALPGILGFNIGRIRRQLWLNHVQEIDGIGVKAGEFSALELIVANPSISQSRLAEAIGTDKANIVSVIDRLEAHEWVCRVRSSSDRRRFALQATEAGRKASEELRQRILERERTFLARCYTEEEVATLFRLLQQLSMPFE